MNKHDIKMYYTDPLAAAYMARDFGVKYEWDSREVEDFPRPLPNKIHPAKYKEGKESFPALFGAYGIVQDCMYKGVTRMDIRTVEGGGMYCICPDSHHIFEPQVGDKDEDGFRFENGAWVRNEMNGSKRIFMSNESYTARRNNRSFFWPEVEDEK